MENLKDYIKIVLGASLMALSLDMFLIPNTIAAGGVSGIAAILEYAFDFKPSLVIAIINVPLFVVGFKTLGKKFLLKSFVGTAVLSIMAEVLYNVPKVTSNLLIASLSGGIVMGIGMGLVMSVNSTTGGTEVLAKILKKRFKKLSVGKLIVIIDGVVIVASALITKVFDLSAYAVISLMVSTYILDVMLDGVDFAKQVYIISEKADEISQKIFSEVNRGVTGVNIRGMYTKKEKTMLLCIVKRSEIPLVKKVVTNIDENAFVMLSDVKEVYGEGFKRGMV